IGITRFPGDSHEKSDNVVSQAAARAERGLGPVELEPAPGRSRIPGADGTVTFTIDGQAQAPVTLSVVGGVDQARLTTSRRAAGPHPVWAAYSGEAKGGSSGASLTQTVNAPSLQPTTTSLVSLLSPSTAGQPVTFTAVVSPGTYAGTPTGTGTFTI